MKCHLRSHMTSMLEKGNLLDAKTACAKVVSNIPFNISTDIVKQLLPMGDIFSEAVLLLQVSMFGSLLFTFMFLIPVLLI